MSDAHRPIAPWTRLLAALAALVLAAGLAGCGDDDDDDAGGDGGGGAAAGTLEITEFQFSDVSAPAGGTLEVVNTSGAGHTVTADGGEFDESVGDGETVEVPVPSEPGEYPFHCEIHSDMQATLTAE